MKQAEILRQQGKITLLWCIYLNFPQELLKFYAYNSKRGPLPRSCVPTPPHQIRQPWVGVLWNLRSESLGRKQNIKTGTTNTNGFSDQWQQWQKELFEVERMWISTSTLSAFSIDECVDALASWMDMTYQYQYYDKKLTCSLNNFSCLAQLFEKSFLLFFPFLGGGEEVVWCSLMKSSVSGIKYSLCCSIIPSWHLIKSLGFHECKEVTLKVVILHPSKKGIVHPNR